MRIITTKKRKVKTMIKTNKKPISSKTMKAKNDWFDTHVEVMSFGSSKENKKIKEIIKKKIINN